MLYRPTTTPQIGSQQNSIFNEEFTDSQNGIQHQHQQHPVQQRLGYQQQESQQQQREGLGTQSGSLLLSVPPETLTCITAYLTPPTLLSLGCTNVILAQHIKADNTWRRAFVCYFLGISPESDIDADDNSGRSTKTLLLRHDKESWREEFIWRFIIIRRWAQSKNLPTTHTPAMQSPVAVMHLLPSAFASGSTNRIIPQPALLTASTQYGIVTRSYPLSGKVLPGYLDASAVGARAPVAWGAHGPAMLGFAPALNHNVGPNLWGPGNFNGNPNAQFTPNITACALSSSLPFGGVSVAAPASGSATASSSGPIGAVAQIAWGTRSGEVIFTTAPRPMEVNSGTGSRRSANPNSTLVRRCAVGEEHQGSVNDVKWVSITAAEVFGTGGNSTGTTEPRKIEGQFAALAVSAGTDGRVKLWKSNVASPTPMCLWTSEAILSREPLGPAAGGGFAPDPCVRAEGLVRVGDEGQGSACVVAAVHGGDVHVWAGFGFNLKVDSVSDPEVGTESRFSAAHVQEFAIPCPAIDSSGTGRDKQPRIVKALHLDPTSSSQEIVFLVAYDDDPLFYRVSVSVPTGDVAVTSFGDPNFGPTSVVVPFFGHTGFSHNFAKDPQKKLNQRESSFVLVGDHIGCVSLYAWDSTSSFSAPSRTASLTPIVPLRQFEAHRDGASVTALWWDGLTLITGSARGTTHVWDGITWAHLRSFVSPIKRTRERGGRGGVGNIQPPVNIIGQGAGGPGLAEQAGQRQRSNREAVTHILVNKEKDVLVVAVGDCVLAWHAGVISSRTRGGDRGGGGVRGRHAPGTGPAGKKRAGGANNKYLGQFEMRQAILESQDMDGASHAPGPSSRAYGQEMAHRAGLESMGLSELEAVEYVLMLSRDEAYARARAEAEAETEMGWSSREDEEGVFEGDFGDADDDGVEDDESAFGAPSLSSFGSSNSTVSLSSGSSGSSGSGSTTTSRGSVTSLGLGRVTRTSARPIPVPSVSNQKLQISPPYRGEPIQAGEEFFAGIAHDEPEQGVGGVIGLDEVFFPPIPGSNPGSTGTSPREEAGIPSLKGKGKKKKTNAKARAQGNQEAPNDAPKQTPKTTPAPTPGASPKSLKTTTSAWSVPLAVRHASSSTSTSRGSAHANTKLGGSSPPVVREDMDEDLRFALELSLVEARSLGEDV